MMAKLSLRLKLSRNQTSKSMLVLRTRHICSATSATHPGSLGNVSSAASMSFLTPMQQLCNSVKTIKLSSMSGQTRLSSTT